MGSTHADCDISPKIVFFFNGFAVDTLLKEIGIALFDVKRCPPHRTVIGNGCLDGERLPLNQPGALCRRSDDDAGWLIGKQPITPVGGGKIAKDVCCHQRKNKLFATVGDLQAEGSRTVLFTKVFGENSGRAVQDGNGGEF
ncbi:MAG: hypothetical protein ACD_75C01367G0006 [uncultured bacterium]|nr:MAG: hypothetical protein ACD_75C01367G0006 [uncultured bacterium]